MTLLLLVSMLYLYYQDQRFLILGPGDARLEELIEDLKQASPIAHGRERRVRRKSPRGFGMRPCGLWAPWQHGREGAPLAERAAHSHRAALRFDDAFGQGKPEPGPFLQRSHVVVELRKLREELRQRRTGDTDAGVAHGKSEHTLAAGREADGDLSGLRGELDGVGEVVVQDLFTSAVC